MGLEADSGAVSEAEGDVEGTGVAAAPAAVIGQGLGSDPVLVGPDKEETRLAWWQAEATFRQPAEEIIQSPQRRRQIKKRFMDQSRQAGRT